MRIDGGDQIEYDSLIVGEDEGYLGEVLVDGANSIWKIDDNLSIGVVGVGTLTLSNQGLLNIDRSGAVVTIGDNGSVYLAGGTLSGQSVISSGYLGGTGLVRGTVTNSVGALIDVPGGPLPAC